MTYMASCGDTTCDKFNGSSAQWFKIDEAGKKTDDPSQWVQQDIMNGDSYTFTLPQDLAPGDYLIRHEVRTRRDMHPPRSVADDDARRSLLFISP